MVSLRGMEPAISEYYRIVEFTVEGLHPRHLPLPKGEHTCAFKIRWTALGLSEMKSHTFFREYLPERVGQEAYKLELGKMGEVRVGSRVRAMALHPAFEDRVIITPFVLASRFKYNLILSQYRSNIQAFALGGFNLEDVVHHLHLRE